MADSLKENYLCECFKYAVSGTTLVDESDSSYVHRMLSIDIRDGKGIDFFICQLSTNDASRNKEIGIVSDSFERKNFDTLTIAGAMEFIISYAKETWNCPVIFYTGTKYQSPLYEKMVDILYKLKDKWNIGIIDLWNDDEMNSVSKDDYARYMCDPIHPTKVGYDEWWTPKFAGYLEKNA